MDAEDDLSSAHSKRSADVRYERPTHEVGRGTFDAVLRDHDSIVRLGCVVVLGYHVTDPRQFACDIKIMCTGLRASFHHGSSILVVRSDGRDEDLCRLGQTK